MMATVVLGIASASLILPYSVGLEIQYESVKKTLASELASALMEQIISTDFENIVGVYGGFGEAAGEIEDINNDEFADTDSRYDYFSRSATCSYVYVPQENGAGASDFIQATVRVYYKGDELVRLDRLIARR